MTNTKNTSKKILYGTLMFTIILIAYLITRSKTKQTPKPQNQTKTPTFLASDLGKTPLQDISWKKTTNDQKLPQSTPNYQAQLTELNTATTQNIAQSLNFSGFATPVKNSYTPVLNWKNSTHHLAIKPELHKIEYSNLRHSYINTQGEFSKNEDELTLEIKLLIKSLKIFDPQLDFQASKIEYFTLAPSYYNPTTKNKAELITITLTPYLNQVPIYLTEDFFIQGTYDKSANLIKMTINKPISSIKKTSTSNLISADKLKKLTPSNFFLVNTNPKTLEEYYLSPPQITSITPEQISLAYTFISNKNLILPIFSIAQDGYIFATPATK